jgi:hypothetical protein
VPAVDRRNGQERRFAGHVAAEPVIQGLIFSEFASVSPSLTNQSCRC